MFGLNPNWLPLVPFEKLGIAEVETEGYPICELLAEEYKPLLGALEPFDEKRALGGAEWFCAD